MKKVNFFYKTFSKILKLKITICISILIIQDNSYFFGGYDASLPFVVIKFSVFATKNAFFDKKTASFFVFRVDVKLQYNFLKTSFSLFCIGNSFFCFPKQSKKSSSGKKLVFGHAQNSSFLGSYHSNDAKMTSISLKNFVQVYQSIYKSKL